MDIGKEFTFDDEKSKEGKWFQVSPEAELKIARWMNPRMQEYVRKKSQPHTRQIQNGTISNELMVDILKEAAAHTVLTDWNGVEYYGEEVEHTPEQVLEMFNEHEEFFEMVREYASDASNYRAEEEDIKNS